MKKTNFKYFKNKFKPIKSFSLLGEDILIKSFFHPNYIGNYIDIGSAHPINGNNTFLFYKKKWRGMLIDPHNDIYKPKKHRKEDTILNYGIKEIKNKNLKSDFFYKKSWLELSSTQLEEFKNLDSFFKEYSQDDPILKKEIILVDALYIKKNFNYDHLDLLSVDIEMYSEKIVIDFIEYFNPKVIIYEKNRKDATNWQKFNYELVASNEMNNILINQKYKKKNIFDY